MLKKDIIAVFLAATFFLNLVAPVGAASIEDKQAELESIQQQLYNKDVERENAKQVVASAPKASAVSRLSAAPPAYAARSWSPVSLDTWGSGAPAIDAAPYSAPFAEPDEDEDSEEDKLFDSDEYLFFDLSNDALLAAEEIDDDLI